MADVFISYSRRDSGYVKTLADDLAEHGKSVWLDTEGIADGEVFPLALQKAIETSSGFVFVISPESAKSPYCAQEVELALQLNKRIVPVVHETVPDDALPEGIRVRNWIPGDDPAHVDRIATALDHDLDHVQAHTRWGLKALEWDQRDHDKSLLLRGAELTAAEAWLAGASGKDPEPTDLQRDYVRAAFAAARRRQRLFTGVSIAVAALSVMLVVYALVSRGQAVDARGKAKAQAVTSRAQALAATSRANVDTDPQVALALAERAVRTEASPQSLFALRGALDAATVLAQYDLPKQCAHESDAAFDASFSPAKAVLATESCDGTMTLRDATTGAVLRTRQIAPTGDGGFYWSPDGTRIAAGGEGSIRILDATTLEEVKRISLPGFNYPDFAPSGRWLLVGNRPQNEGRVRLLRVPLDGGSRRVLAGGLVTYVALFTGGGRVVTTSAPGDRGVVSVLDPASGRVLRQRPAGVVGNTTPVIATSPRSGAIAVGLRDSTGTAVVQLWSTGDLHTIRTLETVPSTTISVMAFSRDGTRLAIGTGRGAGDVRLVDTGEQLTRFAGLPDGVRNLSFSTGTRLSVLDDSGVTRVLRAQGPELVDVVDDLEPAGQISLGYDGATLTALGGAGGFDSAVQRWRSRDGRPLAAPRLPAGTLPTHFTLATGNNPPGMSPDGKIILLPSRQHGRIELGMRSAATGRQLGTIPYTPYQGESFRPGHPGEVLLYDGLSASGTFDTPPRIERIGSRRRIALETGGGLDFANAAADIEYSRDGRFIVGADAGGAIAVWSADDGRLQKTFTAPDALNTVTMDRANRRVLLSGGTGVARIYDWRSGRRLQTLTGHTSSVGLSKFTPDGRYAITISGDLTARVWDAGSGRELRRYTLAAAPYLLAVAPDGRSFAVSDDNGVIRVFDVCTACQDGEALLGLAGRSGRTRLTEPERAIVDGA